MSRGWQTNLVILITKVMPLNKVTRTGSMQGVTNLTFDSYGNGSFLHSESMPWISITSLNLHI